MRFVDTNILLRWLLNDHAALSLKAEKLIADSADGSMLVTGIVVSEMVYVLRGLGYDREQTAGALRLVHRNAAFKFEHEELLFITIELFVETGLDFADCYLLVRSRKEKLGLETFDIKLAKHRDGT